MTFPLFAQPVDSFGAQPEIAIVGQAQLANGSALSCPAGMKLVTGTHQENVQRLCLDFHQGECWSWWPGAMLLEARQTPVSVCMDEFEWPNEKGKLPPVMMRFVEAESDCQGAGKRLCSEFEWETACEGPHILPFPYGYDQDPHACINDKPYKPYSEKALEGNQDVRDRETKRLYQAEPSGSRPSCTSAYGVQDLVGNVEEWVTTSRKEWKYRSSLKGGYWAKPWSGCRGTNDSHGPQFRFYDIGFRCCTDPIVAQKP